ncbi:MAG: hypothetical protein ACRC37_07325, partial [Lentisphaeria bacterium]
MNSANCNSVVDNLLKKFEKIIANKRLGQGYLVVGDNLDELRKFVEGLVSLCVKDYYNKSVYSYPFLTEIKPRSVSRVIRVDEIRELERHFQIKAEKGFLRIGIIWECDRMNEQSQNAFLKTLEEPSPGVLIILVSERPGAMLSTIRSRCQLIPIRTGQNYDFEDSAKVAKILATLLPGSGAECALAASTALAGIFAGLSKKAENLVTLIDKIEGETKADKKLREDTNKALLRSEYLSLRERYIGLISTWFSQLVLLNNGLSVEQLPHSEL